MRQHEIQKARCNRIGVAVFLMISVTAGRSKSQTNDRAGYKAIGLESYISYAFEHNPLVKSMLDDIEVSKLDARRASSLPDPMFMVKSSITERTSVKAIGGSQMIMWPGKLVAMRNVGKFITEAKEQNLIAALASIEADIRSSWVTLFALGQTIKRQEENLDLLRQFEQIARMQYITSGISRSPAPASGSAMAGASAPSSTSSSGMSSMGPAASSQQSGISSSPGSMSPMSSGTTSQAALIIIQVEQTMLEDQIRSTRVQLETERSRFRAQLGVDTTFPINLPMEIVAVSLPEKELVVKAIKDKSPGIIAMDKEIASAAAMVHSAKQGFFPDIEVGLEYMPSLSSGSAMSESSISENSGDWETSVSLSIPLWLGTKKREVDRAEKMKTAMIHQRDNMRNMIGADAERLFNNVYDAERRIGLYRDVLIARSKQIVDILLSGYSTGQSSFLDIIGEQRKLLDLQVTLANEQAKRETAVAGIIRLLGSEQLVAVASSVLF